MDALDIALAFSARYLGTLKGHTQTVVAKACRINLRRMCFVLDRTS